MCRSCFHHSTLLLKTSSSDTTQKINTWKLVTCAPSRNDLMGTFWSFSCFFFLLSRRLGSKQNNERIAFMGMEDEDGSAKCFNLNTINQNRSIRLPNTFDFNIEAFFSVVFLCVRPTMFADQRCLTFFSFVCSLTDFFYRRRFCLNWNLIAWKKNAKESN